MKYRSRYEYSRPFGKPRHDWIVIAATRGIQLHISDMGEKEAKEHGYDRFSAGIEIHYRYPPDYMEYDAPSHDNCWVLHCPCWHDGSSLQASEFWVPFWLANPTDHDRMFTALENRLGEDDHPISCLQVLREAVK